MCIDNSANADARARIFYARNDFSAGGTATARPTSTTEFEGAYFYTTNTAPNIWTNASYGTVRYVSIAVDANGQFYFYMARGGTNSIESLSCCVENINTDDRDLYRQWASTCHFGNHLAVGQRTWTGGVRPFFQEPTYPELGSTSGGLIRYHFGACFWNSQNNTQAVGGAVNGLGNYGYGMNATTGATGNGQNMDMFGAPLTADVDAYYLALPMYVIDYGTGRYSQQGGYNSSGNTPQWRGQIPDAWYIATSAPTGASFPSAAAQTHVVSATSGGWNPKTITPMSVQLIL
jgi:hypothetical protein